MKTEQKTQTQLMTFHGACTRIEAVDLGGQGFNVAVWGDCDGDETLIDMRAVDTYENMMDFVVAAASV